MQIGHGKQGVLIGEYTEYREPDLLGESKELLGKSETTPSSGADHSIIIGYIEPACDNPQWIIWFTNKGDAILHRKRSSTGAVEDQALQIKASKPTPLSESLGLGRPIARK